MIFRGTTTCLSALFLAKYYTELLELLAKAVFKWWHYRCWGDKSIVVMGELDEALKYAEESNGSNVPELQIALICEELLITVGMIEEACKKYALMARQKMTKPATFRAIIKNIFLNRYQIF